MTNVTLCIYGDRLDPTQMSTRLGLRPTESFRRGEPIVTKRRQYSDHPTGGWLLSSRDRVSSGELEAHFVWLLQQIEPVAEVLRELQLEGNDIALICVLSGSPTGGGPTIGAPMMARIANLKVPVDFDIYD